MWMVLCVGKAEILRRYSIRTDRFQNHPKKVQDKSILSKMYILNLSEDGNFLFPRYPASANLHEMPEKNPHKKVSISRKNQTSFAAKVFFRKML